MAKRYNITGTPKYLERYEQEIKERWAAEANAKNDRIIGKGYAERQIADTLSKVDPIDVHISKSGKNMDDLIRRGTVIETLADNFEGNRDAWKEIFSKMLEDVPGIKAKSGSWKRDTWKERFAPGLHYFVCSCCSTYNDTRSNYCPNCGAFMKGKK